MFDIHTWKKFKVEVVYLVERMSSKLGAWMTYHMIDDISEEKEKKNIDLFRSHRSNQVRLVSCFTVNNSQSIGDSENIKEGNFV